jgi:hypothetical protein
VRGRTGAEGYSIVVEILHAFSMGSMVFCRDCCEDWNVDCSVSLRRSFDGIEWVVWKSVHAVVI